MMPLGGDFGTKKGVKNAGLNFDQILDQKPESSRACGVPKEKNASQQAYKPASQHASCKGQGHGKLQAAVANCKVMQVASCRGRAREGKLQGK